jgi:membrane-associated phospholipid phosphatase
VPAQDFRDAEHTAFSFLKAPFHASSGDLVLAAGLIGSVALASTMDRQVHDDVLEIDKPWAKTTDVIGNTFQSAYVVFGSAGALYGYGWLKDKPEIRRVGLEVVEAYAIAGVGVQVVKHLAGRARPYQNLGPSTFHGPRFDNKNHSFFSGDASVAFAFASVLSAEAKSWPVTIGLYSLATMTSFQRLHKNKHWFSDVTGGMIWGTTVGLSVVKLHHGNNGSNVSLIVKPNGVGIQVNR